MGDSEEWWSRTGSREIAMCHEVIGGLVSPRWRREASIATRPPTSTLRRSCMNVDVEKQDDACILLHGRKLGDDDFGEFDGDEFDDDQFDGMGD